MNIWAFHDYYTCSANAYLALMLTLPQQSC